MKVVVNDANLLIDIVKLEMVTVFFQLDLAFYTTDLVYGEVNEAQAQYLQPYVDEGILRVERLTTEEIVELYEKTSTIRNLSDNDLSAFLLAQKRQGILLTSDNCFRKYARDSEQEVHGHLWVLDILVEGQIITPAKASDLLRRLCDEINPFLGLPAHECEKRHRRWSQQ